MENVTHGLDVRCHLYAWQLGLLAPGREIPRDFGEVEPEMGGLWGGTSVRFNAIDSSFQGSHFLQIIES